jgi:hypothetical protein
MTRIRSSHAGHRKTSQELRGSASYGRNLMSASETTVSLAEHSTPSRKRCHRMFIGTSAFFHPMADATVLQQSATRSLTSLAGRTLTK